MLGAKDSILSHAALQSGPIRVLASATWSAYHRSMPLNYRRVTVALDGSDAVLSWASREALMQRLQDMSERSHIRARFDPDGASPVKLTPGQRARLLVILDDSPETMPQELLELREALITDVRCRE